MTTITLEDVTRLAQLSALSIDDAEAEALRKQLEDILGYVAQLDQVDTTGVEPTYQVTGLENVTRPDDIDDEGITHDDLLRNAPDTLGGQVKVRRVL